MIVLFASLFFLTFTIFFSLFLPFYVRRHFSFSRFLFFRASANLNDVTAACVVTETWHAYAFTMWLRSLRSSFSVSIEIKYGMVGVACVTVYGRNSPR